MGVEEVGLIQAKIWPYLLVGIALGAAIHGWARHWPCDEWGGRCKAGVGTDGGSRWHHS